MDDNNFWIQPEDYPTDPEVIIAAYMVVSDWNKNRRILTGGGNDIPPSSYASFPSQEDSDFTKINKRLDKIEKLISKLLEEKNEKQ